MHTAKGLWGALILTSVAGVGCGGDPTPPLPLDAATGIDAAVDAGEDLRARCNPRRRRADGGTAFELDPACPLPNLVPVIRNVQVQTRVFSPSSCEVMEGCTVAGRRRLLRFDLVTPNVGAGDLYLGPPVVDNRPDGRFEYGACHMHWHFRGYADYRLLDGMNREVGMGHKQSFCLLDSGRHLSDAPSFPPREVYTCSDQGIHAGWYDLYDRALDCQYIDVTGVAPGTYRVRARINELRGLTESNYDDNETLYEVTLPAEDAPSSDPTDACAADESGAARDCGWAVSRGSTCAPGTTVTLGCNATCTPAVGSCAGDPVLRVCPGDGPCTHADAVAEGDDACGSACPSVSFQCPPRGRYTVLTGASRSGGAHECHVEIAP